MSLVTSRLGLLVAGSVAEGLTARLDPAVAIEDVRLGKFVKIVGQKYEYFCLVTDVQLDSANNDVLRDPPGDPSKIDVFLRQVLSGTTTYALVKLKPELMLANLAADVEFEDADMAPRPARTIPPHFSNVSEATLADFERVFGRDDGRNHFQIGQPIDMDVPVCVDLRRFVERSNGIFGKSGTGKSFLTRLLLCGVIKAGAAVNLIFDMHSEYGWSAKNEEGTEVKGLSQLFGSRVAVYTLDMESSRGRGVKPAGEIKIALRELSVADIALLQDELRLHRTAVESAALCEDKLGGDWVARLLDMNGDELTDFANLEGGNHASLSALRSKLRLIDRLPFVERSLERSTLDQVIAQLERGQHVVLEFGRQRNLLAYILAANVITRRLHELWVKKTERYWNTKDEADRPRPLMITIEEAHKFLNSDAARQTTFGTIARELRKFYVTLLVVDQRPSGIDAEVLSQIGTRITCQLNDERDIDAIFTGVSGGSHLRTVLATLDSREQALVLGHAVPMPMMVRTRKYDPVFYAAVGADEGTTIAARARRYAEIFGDE
ncbi:MAG: ATP-binding protein [Chloroflexi bacterium]|nr:ATP-binding protein [Chloroflexota bacterium]MBV9600005.1 ATP-binding protein [Chloroflexota bacterium]